MTTVCKSHIRWSPEPSDGPPASTQGFCVKFQTNKSKSSFFVVGSKLTELAVMR